MRAFVLPKGEDGRKPFLLQGKEVRYLLRVLRLKEGDSIDAMGPGGEALVLRVGRSDGAGLWLDPQGSAERAPGATEPGERGGGISISLYQCLPKGTRMDAVVRMAAEAGAVRIVPVLSERTIPRPGDESARLDRWRRIVKEARQQSGSTVDTRVEGFLPLSKVAADWRGDGPGIFFHEAPLAKTGLHGYLSDAPRSAAVLIGPEGGLSAAETDALGASGWKPCWLGSRVLRADTAGAYALAAIQTLILERNSWVLKQAFPPSE
jgi:16S rRNA (uracil1498-N3)-methyltransferase